MGEQQKRSDNMFTQRFYNGFFTAVDMQFLVNIFQMAPGGVK